MKPEIPETVRKQMQKAGRARAALMSPEDRSQYGRKAWQTRLANASKSDSKPISPPTPGGT